ncbi:MAG: glycosyltransferase [Treponema sp.]|nr:glycosyltransferase [Treponema sp.]
MQKRKYLSKKNIVFISPSNWERECLEHSSLFHGHKCFTIPNIIPKSIFKPLDKKTIRNILGIPKGKKIIGFGASFDINNPRGIKGSFYLLEALQKLKNKDDYFFLVFGDVNAAFASRLPLPYFSAGFITNEKILSLLYNALDVFICPSIVESLSLTVLEALFSGVPSVAFDVGGVVDIIEHKKTGYLAKPYDTDDLASGIEWCLSKRSKLSKECLKKAAADFDEEQIVTKHIEVYDLALRESRS